MSGGETFYLAMVVVGVGVFALVLAYYSHQSTLTQRRIATRPRQVATPGPATASAPAAA